MNSNNPSRDKLTSVAIGVALSSTLAFSSAFADDTEVFFGHVASNSSTHPNVLFVLDSSGSMNWTDGTDESRLERMKSAVYTILDETANVNVGLMRFNGTNGGGAVLHPMRPIDGLVCAGSDCGQISEVSKVSQSSGDSEQFGDTTAIDLDGNSLRVGQTEEGVDRKIGLHFQNLRIPQGATITSATIDFNSAADNHSIAAFYVGAEQVDDADLLTNVDNDLGSRTLGQTVPWSPSGWLKNADYTSEDITPVIQEIVERTNWCGGNDINIVIGGTGTREIWSYDKWATSAPTLRLNYTTDNIPAGGGCMRISTLSQVSSGKDDAEQFISTKNTNTGSSDLELPRDGNSEQLIGLRFPKLAVPQGAIIESAFIEFTTDRDRTGQISMNISAQKIDDAPAFKDKKRNISNRELTAPVPWPDLPTAAVGEAVLTTDVSVALQEVIDRSGWVEGNAAAFVLSKRSGSGFREYESYNGSPNTPPKLKVKYRYVVGASNPAQITVRDKLKNIVSDMVATGGTPIVDAYYEASLYMTGGAVDYGLDRGTSGNSGERYHRTSHIDSWQGGELKRDSSCSPDNLNSSDCAKEYITGPAQYMTPMGSSCQTNHIVFLTDGEPTSNSSANKVKALTGVDSCAAVNDNDELCGRELAHWLQDNDHNPLVAEKQNISTYTIGFNYAGTFLKDLASKGEGQYFKAESSAQLVDVFKDILGDVLAVESSFVAPGATVNQFNRLTHRNDIYFALFKPDQRPTWGGNLKRYQIGKDSDGELGILDFKGKSAVDELTGFFHSESESWWSGFQDGNTVAVGGAAQQLNYDGSGLYPSRRVYTYVGDYGSLPSNGADLTAATSKLHESNSSITLDHLGIQSMVATDAEKNAFRSNLLKWTRGLDVKDENDDGSFTDFRQHMSDPMHARPVILNYATSDPDAALSTVFVGTNEGYLHAIEREEGNELYAFMPKELLSNIRPYFDNQSSSGHPYGLDGSLSLWTDDKNNNVMVDSDEPAYIYTGMRRGGRNYYALDVSERRNPKLAWAIEGGPGGTPGFEELGESWSRMVPNTIVLNGVEENVLIFAAGYNTNQDPDHIGLVMSQTPDNSGRGFFIVRAETGELLWSVLGEGGTQTIADMDYSVPSDIRALDTNNDGLTDQLYFGDMGGQIWRFDFKQHHIASDGDLLQGGVIANLSNSLAQNHRRFYYEPDIAVISHEGERFLSISIGSGWRAHPLNQVVEDRFYVLRYNNVLGTPDGYGKSDPITGLYSPITEADLIDVTGDIDAEVGPHGWYLDMPDSGEKILGSSVTMNNQVIFASYKPEATASDCSPAIGGGAAYVMNILNGSPRIDLDGDGDVDIEDISKDLAHGGIPPPPTVLITEDGPLVLVGPEKLKTKSPNLTQRTYWYKPNDKTATDVVEVTGN